MIILMINDDSDYIDDSRDEYDHIYDSGWMMTILMIKDDIDHIDDG